MGHLKLYKGGLTTVIRLNKEPINIAYWYLQTSHMMGLFGGGSKGTGNLVNDIVDSNGTCKHDNIC